MTEGDKSSSANRHIFNFLKYYVKLPHNPNYALMLNGAWGIGKTHLITKFLDDELKENQPYIYVSLYGLISSDQIAEAIFRKRFPIIDNKGTKLAGVAAKTAMKHFNLVPDLKITDFTGTDRTKLYVFDDLERTQMPTQEALGFINQLVEHDGCKVVIIANESEINDQKCNGEENERKNQYLRIKEKLIGKTLVVQPSLEDALEHFINQVPKTKTRDFYNKNHADIRTVYQCAGIDNLRILQHALWDFDHLYSLLSAEHVKAEIACRLLFQQFLAYSFDFKIGRITEPDLEQDFNYYFILHNDSEGKELTPIEKTVKRYTQVIRLYDRILPPELLVETIAHGLFDKDKIINSLDNHSYFRNHGPEKPWITLWYRRERHDEEFETALKMLEQQLENREIVIIGEILHIFGLMLWMAKNGFDDTPLENVVSICKTYIDDLLSNEKLEPMPINGSDDSIQRNGGWGGLGFNESDSPEYQELYTYLEEKRYEAQRLSYKAMASSLLDVMKKDATLFMKKINDGTEDSEFYNTPILEVIPAKKFVDEIFSTPISGRSTIIYAIQKRHEYRPPNRQLKTEIKWLGEVKQEFQSKAEDAPRLLKYQIKEYIKQIDTILSKHN